MSRQALRARGWVAPSAGFLVLVVSTGLAAWIFYRRYVWAWPDVPYLTQLTALPTIGSALDGDYGALIAPFFKFYGEHRVGAYTAYLFLNARFSHYSTHTEFAIWTASIASQCIMSAYYVFYRMRTRLLTPAFFVALLIPLVALSPAFAPGRGMETQVQVSVSLYFALMLMATSRLGEKTFAFIALPATGAYVMGFAAGYFAVGALALTATAVFTRFAVPSRTIRRKSAFLAVITAVWAIVYVITMKLFATPSQPTSPTFVSAATGDPLFAPTYLLRALAGTATTINAQERFGSDFAWISTSTGALVVIAVVSVIIAVLRSKLARRDAVFPISLVFYSTSVALLVMIGRPESGFWPLNMWYGFQYRPMAIGILLLVILALNRRLLRRRRFLSIQIVVAGATLITVLALTTEYQLNRNYAERDYFIAIRSWLLNPTPTANENGLTPVYLNDASSRAAIMFLRTRHLTPFK